jgi:hypothetical protein
MPLAGKVTILITRLFAREIFIGFVCVGKIVSCLVNW